MFNFLMELSIGNQSIILTQSFHYLINMGVLIKMSINHHFSFVKWRVGRNFWYNQSCYQHKVKVFMVVIKDQHP
jgi:hypothetical protein